MKKGILIVVILFMTAAIMYAADCTCAVGCSSITAITIPFTKDGVADACYQTPCLGSSINSWNLTTLNINGTDFTNKWADAGTYPAAINGQYYIYFKSTVSYGHFEALGSCSGSTTAPNDTIAPTNPPTDTQAVTNPPDTPAPTNPPGVTAAPTETPGPTAIPTATPAGVVTDAPTAVTTAGPTDLITPAPTDVPGVTSAPGSLDCSTAAFWSATTAYETTGKIVYYNGNLYSNNWYSLNENPETNSGTGKVWTLVGACDPALTPAPTPTPRPAPTQGSGTNGYATRFWDCCKPHCSWTANVPAGMAPLRTCQIDGKTNNPDVEAKSSCEGGTSYVCYSFIPWAVNDDLSYGFAATSSGDVCGRCFELQFTGTGKYSNTPGAVALQGKRMIVQAINIGFDVGGGQFDVMVPGGGVGAFNGCSTQWGISNDVLGAQYGGLLTACNQEVGYYDHEAIKNCLRSKNDSLFRAKGLTEMAAGLDWFINWYEAADNPNLYYWEVTCPQELINISGMQR